LGYLRLLSPRHLLELQNFMSSMFLNQLFGLQGQRALVTGSSQGIGFALAQGLAKAGASVVLNGRNAEKCTAAAKVLRDQGVQADTAVFDVTDAAAVSAGVAAIEKDIGPIDILVNNAGIQIRGPLHEFSEIDWQRLMRTNLDSVFFVGQAVAKHMIARHKGKIVNVCSVQSELGRPGIAPYTASKGAVKMLTKGMCIDWGPLGLQVNGLAPGYFDTELTAPLVADEKFTAWLSDRTPARRWGQVDELVGATVFLASPSASFMNGHVLYVDGGITSRL
jgi:gluconate 5-dehydrogenase